MYRQHTYKIIKLKSFIRTKNIKKKEKGETFQLYHQTIVSFY